MNYKSKSTGQVITQVDYDMMWSILENYRDTSITHPDNIKNTVAIVTILNDFTEVVIE